MKQLKLYKYVSNSGAVITPINLEIGDPIVFYQLSSEGNKTLTNGEARKNIVNVAEDDIILWQEVDKTEEEILRDTPPVLEEIEDETNYKELLDIVTGTDAE